MHGEKKEEPSPELYIAVNGQPDLIDVGEDGLVKKQSEIKMKILDLEESKDFREKVRNWDSKTS